MAVINPRGWLDMAGQRPEPKTDSEAILQVRDVVFNIEQNIERMCALCDRHDMEIKRLQVWQARLIGGGIVAASILGYILKLAFDHVNEIAAAVAHRP